ncbi:hypothetical protein ABZX41_27185, partial [Streptomyces sp. NPDC004533]
MVTFAQAQERAEEWINGDVPSYQHREVRVREFGLGFVVWAEDRADGPRSDGGAQRIVIARDSGEASLWPGLPVGEVIRRYEEEYGAKETAAQSASAAAARSDLNQTSFLLTPPEWGDEAADRKGTPEQRQGGGGPTGAGASASAAPASGAFGTSGGAGGVGPASAASWPAAGGGDEVRDAVPVASAGVTPWAGTDTSAEAGEDGSVPLPETVFAPQLSDTDRGAAPVAPPASATSAAAASKTPAPPGAPGAPGVPPASGVPGAPGMPTPPGVPQGPPPPPGPAPVGGSQPPGVPQPPVGPSAPGPRRAPNAEDIAPGPRRGPGPGRRPARFHRARQTCRA